jgi:hypothetical protein
MEQGDTRIIGAWYVYTAPYPSYRFDKPVLLCGVRKMDAGPDDPQRADIRNDTDLAKQGGMATNDIAFIRGWLPDVHRPSFVEDDCLVSDLKALPESQWPCDIEAAVTWYAIDEEGNVLDTAEATDPHHAEFVMTDRMMADRDKYTKWSANRFMVVSVPPCNCGI